MTYLSIGENAYEKSHIDGVKSFAQSLKAVAPEALNWQVNTEDKLYYMPRPIITVINGIEKLFDDYHNELAADSAISKQGAESIIKYYAALSEKKYGFMKGNQPGVKLIPLVA